MFLLWINVYSPPFSATIFSYKLMKLILFSLYIYIKINIFSFAYLNELLASQRELLCCVLQFQKIVIYHHYHIFALFIFNSDANLNYVEAFQPYKLKNLHKYITHITKSATHFMLLSCTGDNSSFSPIDFKWIFFV